MQSKEYVNRKKEGQTGTNSTELDCDESEEYRNGEVDPNAPKTFELNLDPKYWVKNFLYPFALDPAPLRLDASKQTPEEIIAEKKRQKLLGDESILNTTKYQFPANQIKKYEHLIEIQTPIEKTIDQIRGDMFKYADTFDREQIPHITTNDLKIKSLSGN